MDLSRGLDEPFLVSMMVMPQGCCHLSSQSTLQRKREWEGTKMAMAELEGLDTALPVVPEHPGLGGTGEVGSAVNAVSP